MDLWFFETETENIRVQWKVIQTLASQKSQFQQVDILEFAEFGRGLVLDGVIQTTLADEFMYHEMLVHVPLMSHPAPERVLVVGGGDGGTVREVLKHPTVEHVDLVEIDRVVVDMCRQYLPELAGCLDDPRVHVNIEDGLDFMRQRRQQYDCILVDSSDPVGPATGLFGREFYLDAHGALAPGGIMAAHTESPLFNQELIRRINMELSLIFPLCRFYMGSVPTYSIGPWSFVLAAKGGSLSTATRSVPGGCRYYNAAIHQGAFQLPQYFVDLLEQKK